MMRKDWIEVELRLLLSHVIGGDWGKSLDYTDNEYETVYCIRGTEFKNWKIEKGKTASLRKVKRSSLEKRELAIGDILLEISGGGPEQPVGRTVLVDNSVLYNLRNHKIVCTNFLRLLRPLDFLNSEWINTYLSFFHNSGKTIPYQGGSNNLRNLNYKQFQTIKIPLAPFPEQRAILTKIEQLFSELDNGIANLKKAKEKLEIYRQAVLKKAFEGELTKEWREEQADLPSVDRLLEQIQEERQKFYESQLQEWEKAVKEWEFNKKTGKKPTRISKPKTIEDISEDATERYGRLPEKWKWTSFCNVTYKIGDVDHKMPKEYPGGLPYLSTSNLKSDGTIDFDNAKTISPEDFFRLSLKIKPEKGDIIFPRYGTIGRNVLITCNKQFLVSYSCAIIKNILKVMNEKFVYYYSISPIIKKEIKRYIVQTTQANIGISSIEKFVFPLCSKQEQTKIVEAIETRLSVCDNILANIDESLEKAEALRKSILKKAFEGRLLSKDEIEACRKEPDWEPAEKLLERIKNKRKEAYSIE